MVETIRVRMPQMVLVLADRRLMKVCYLQLMCLEMV